MKRCRGEIDRLIDWIGLLLHEVGLTADRGMQKKACDRQARGIGMCQIDSDRDLMPRGVRGRYVKLILVEDKGKRKYRKARQQGGDEWLA